MYLKANVLRIFRDNSRFDLATIYKRKYVKKPILASLGIQIFKIFYPVQTIVVPPGETHISKLLTTLLIFTRAHERLFIVLSILGIPEFHMNFTWIHEFQWISYILLVVLVEDRMISISSPEILLLLKFTLFWTIVHERFSVISHLMPEIPVSQYVGDYIFARMIILEKQS